MNTVITTAYDPKTSQIVRIGDAVSGGRYRGVPGSYCQCCILFPKRGFQRRQPHFAHFPTNPYCAPYKRGESLEHRGSKNAWADFLEDQLSGCAICVEYGRSKYPDHEHPAKYVNEDVLLARPELWGVIWTCVECSQPHFYDLLQTGDSIKREWSSPKRETQVDIALLDSNHDIATIIEVRRTHISDRSREYADSLGIPWFVLDVSQWENTHPMHLFAPVQPLDDCPAIEGYPPRNFELIRHTVSSELQDCFVFRWYFDSQGRLTASIDCLSDDDAEVMYYIPKPSIARYVLASETNITCERAQEYILGKTVHPSKGRPIRRMSGAIWMKKVSR